jgi:hypothetical protein
MLVFWTDSRYTSISGGNQIMSSIFPVFILLKKVRIPCRGRNGHEAGRMARQGTQGGRIICRAIKGGIPEMVENASGNLDRRGHRINEIQD